MESPTHITKEEFNKFISFLISSLEYYKRLDPYIVKTSALAARFHNVNNLRIDLKPDILDNRLDLVIRYIMTCISDNQENSLIIAKENYGAFEQTWLAFLRLVKLKERNMCDLDNNDKQTLFLILCDRLTLAKEEIENLEVRKAFYSSLLNSVLNSRIPGVRSLYEEIKYEADFIQLCIYIAEY